MTLREGVQCLNKKWHSGSDVLVIVNGVHGDSVLCTSCDKTFVSAEHARQHCLSFEHSEATLRHEDEVDADLHEKGKRARGGGRVTSAKFKNPLQPMISWLDSLLARISNDAAPIAEAENGPPIGGVVHRESGPIFVKVEVKDEDTPERKAMRRESVQGKDASSARKESVSQGVTTDTNKSFPRNPFQCELLSRSSVKGFYESRYADIPLSSFGCEALYPNGALPRRAAWIGRPCCYLRLGTALVVTGVIVEALDNCAQVSPDRGQNVAVEWVPAGRLYAIPADLPAVRRAMAEGVVSCLTDPLAALKMSLDE